MPTKPRLVQSQRHKYHSKEWKLDFEPAGEGQAQTVMHSQGKWSPCEGQARGAAGLSWALSDVSQ